MTKKLLLKDVARLAGVSEMTASRALRGAPDVSAKTKAKIEEIARSHGYVPNRIAGSLSSQSVNLVAVVVPSLNSFVFPEVLSGISAVLKDSPLKPVVGISGYDLEEEESVIREMLSWRPSGLIVAGLALGGCFCNDLRYTAETMGVDLDTVEVTVTVTLEGEPLVTTAAHMQVVCTRTDGGDCGELIDRARQSCMVSNSLQRGVAVSIVNGLA